MYIYVHMLWAKFGFAPSEDFTVQRVDQRFAQQTEDRMYIQSSDLAALQLSYVKCTLQYI